MPSDASTQQSDPPAPWLRWVARCGIVAEGSIYLLIGGLALAGAFDPAQRASGSSGAMSKLDAAPLGHLLLTVLALGLAAFVVWQLVQALLDPECRHDRWVLKRVALRIHHLWNAVAHCVLVGMAVWQLLGYGAGNNQGKTPQHLSAIAMRLPAGRWLISAIGIGFVVFALIEWILACRPQKATRMKLNTTAWRRPILALLVLGFVARGVLFGLIGAFLIRAAWQHDPHQATGIAGALQSIRHQPFGPWLLGAVAIGLIAFGLGQIAKVRYRELRTG